MNVVITIFTSSLIVLVTSVHGQQTPRFRQTYRYELRHPRLTSSLPRPEPFFNSQLEISTRVPSFHPQRKFDKRPSPLVPDFLNNLFRSPGLIKDVSSNFVPDFLFTPSTVGEPAATLGQIENFNKDLDELAMEMEQERNNATSNFRGKSRREPTLFVSVNSALYNYNYTVS